MKKIILFTFIFLAVISFKSTSAQDTLQRYQFSQLLTQYYNVKDALVTGNPAVASQKAEEFIRIANSIDYKLISEGNINALLKDASPIADAGDIGLQRKHFANLSNNMITLVKELSLTREPVYIQYCPMKKANWLSNHEAIKNPYYGNTMLTCGKVVETIN
jgi:hypothetical protein